MIGSENASAPKNEAVRPVTIQLSSRAHQSKGSALVLIKLRYRPKIPKAAKMNPAIPQEWEPPHAGKAKFAALVTIDSSKNGRMIGNKVRQMPDATKQNAVRGR